MRFAPRLACAALPVSACAHYQNAGIESEPPGPSSDRELERRLQIEIAP